MQWEDEGVILRARPHGERNAIVTAFTRDHGRCAGLARGVLASTRRLTLQPGALTRLRWRARLEEQLGSFAAEPLRSYGTPLLPFPGPLAALNAVCALTDAGFAERAPHPDFYPRLLALLAVLPDPGWAAAYARWELELLTALGFGLDLRACAVSGVVTDLIYVSPRSGRAVSSAVGAPYHDKLLPLPAFLRETPPTDTPTLGAVRAGLRLTGYFLARHVTAPHPPPARERLLQWLARSNGAQGSTQQL